MTSMYITFVDISVDLSHREMVSSKIKLRYNLICSNLFPLNFFNWPISAGSEFNCFERKKDQEVIFDK